MRGLQLLVKKWRGVEAGMDARILNELWILGILTLGGPLDPSHPTAGQVIKDKERGEAAETAMLDLLVTIIKPLSMIMDELQVDEDEQREDVDSEEDDYMGASFDWDADECIPPTTTTTRPKSKSKRLPSPPIAFLSPPPIPIIFHTITTITTLASRSTSLPSLQLTALEALRLIIQFYLVPHSGNSKSPIASNTDSVSPLIATALPGTASTLTRIILSTLSESNQSQRQPAPIIVSSLATLSVLIISALSDRVTASLRSSARVKQGNEASLEELGAEFNVGSRMQEPEISVEEGLTIEEGPRSIPSLTGPTLPSSAWLQHTLDRITALFISLTLLNSHDSPLVRTAFVEFCTNILDACSVTLADSKRILLESLFSLSNDSWPTVSTPARHHVTLFLQGDARDEYAKLAGSIIRDKFTSLPRSILRGDEATVRNSAGVIQSGLRYAPSLSTSHQGLLEAIDRWSWAILRSLTFERINTTAGENNKNNMSQAWITSGELYEADSAEDWPVLRLNQLDDQGTVKELDRLWNEMGRWAKDAEQEREIITPFLRLVVGGASGDGIALSAAFILNGMLKGFESSDGQEVKKGAKKMIKVVVKGVLSLLDQLEEMENVVEDVTAEKAEELDVMADSSIPLLVEHRKGATSLIPALDGLNPVVTTSATTSSLALASHRITLICFSLRILSTCATLLSSSFEPYLLQALYHILAHTSPTAHPLLREYAQLALSRIASATTYASPQNLILANVDYVVNSVSQRLSISRLDPAAPLVLVEMIRLVGEPIVPMVQDLVEDVFEALDDYHGYEEVTVGLWAVLDALMRVMAGTIIEAEVENEGKPNVLIDKIIKPGSDMEWERFTEWYSQRQRELPSTSPLSPHPHNPFDILPPLESDDPTQPPADSDPDRDAAEDTPKLPPTRSQLVGSQILAKALYFLTHSSPFLRTRVISLLTSSIPLLCSPSSLTDLTSTREGDLLPVIHRAWPYLLNRLLDQEVYVVVETMGLMERLAEFVGEFMSRRILEDVWPRYKGILEGSRKKEKTSGGGGRGGGGGGRGERRFMESSKLIKGILRCMIKVIQKVPLKDDVCWELTRGFTRFLDQRGEEDIQRLAREAFVELGKINPDVVWLVLNGLGKGRVDEGLPLFLKEDGLEVGDNVQIVLDSLQ
jgi:hypothetical protein